MMNYTTGARAATYLDAQCLRGYRPCCDIWLPRFYVRDRDRVRDQPAGERNIVRQYVCKGEAERSIRTEARRWRQDRDQGSVSLGEAE